MKRMADLPVRDRNIKIEFGIRGHKAYVRPMRTFCIVAKDKFTMTVKGESMQVFKDSSPPVLVINSEDKRAVAAFAMTEVLCVYEQETKL